jgi:S-formylglutathione hydrolase FrmB
MGNFRLFCVLSVLAISVSGCGDEPKKRVELQLAGDGCGQGQGYSVCALSPTDSEINGNAIYVFHGMGGDARQMFEVFAPALKAQKETNGFETPALISVSFGQTWLFGPETDTQANRLMYDFVNVVMPEIEAKLGGIKGTRALVGASMGGFNAAQIYLSHPKLFNRVALLCPALSELSPHAPDDVVNGLVTTGGFSAESVRQARGLAKSYFPTEESWQKSNPLSTVERLANDQSAPIFLSIAANDPFTFTLGTRAFDRKLRAAGVQTVESVEVPGNKHCDYDSRALRVFLEPVSQFPTLP